METSRAALNAVSGQLAPTRPRPGIGHNSGVPQDKPRPMWCDTEQAAAYIGSRPKTLEHWRSVGNGPRYAKSGRSCRYRYDWLDEWLESRSVTSTAEARRAGIL
jgi:hypothetical protein